MDPLAELITTYNELNASVIAELDEEPSPLEFMRFVATNTPFVVRRGAGHWPAAQTWNANHLLDALRGHAVNVAVTPYGWVARPLFLVATPQRLIAPRRVAWDPVTPTLPPAMRAGAPSLPSRTRRTSRSTSSSPT